MRIFYDNKTMGKPMIFKCGNHWCIEWFKGENFYSYCFHTWDSCINLARKVGYTNMQETISFDQLEREMKKEGFTKLALLFIDSTHPGEFRWCLRWLAGVPNDEINASCKRFNIERTTAEKKMLMGGYLLQ